MGWFKNDIPGGGGAGSFNLVTLAAGVGSAVVDWVAPSWVKDLTTWLFGPGLGWLDVATDHMKEWFLRHAFKYIALMLTEISPGMSSVTPAATTMWASIMSWVTAINWWLPLPYILIMFVAWSTWKIGFIVGRTMFRVVRG
jgi:hypothetical protein